MIGPFRGGRVAAVAGVTGDATTFYTSSVGGGVWKTTNAGVTWFPIFDSPAHRVDRRDRGGSVRRQRDLRGHGRGRYPLPDRLRRRRVQIHRCRKDLAQRRAEGHTADRHDPGGPARSEPGVRSGAGPRLRPESRARRVPLARRRRHVAEGAGQGAGHRRSGPGAGPRGRAHHLRYHLERAAPGVEPVRAE